MREKDPLSIANLAAKRNPFVEADVIKIRSETRSATIRLRNTSQEVIVNLGPIDPSCLREDRSRLLVYVNPAGGPVIPIAVVPTKMGSIARPDVTLGDHRGATAWSVANNFGNVVFSVDSLGNVTMGTYNAYNIASYLIDIPFVTLAPSTHLTQERVLRDGIGTYISYDATYVEVDLFFDDPTPSTITYASTADPGVGTYAARWDHEHGIEASFDPGPAAYIVITNSSGYVAFEGLGIGAMPTSDDLHIATGQGIVHADGVVAGMFLRANGTRYVPDTLDVGDLTDLAYAVPNLILTTANAAGAANTVIRSDASIAIFDANVPTTIQPDDAAAVGVAAFAARRDHTHAITCDTPGTIEPDDSAEEGVAYYFARSDHQHAIACAIAGAIEPDDSAAEGSASSFSRSDHQHSITCAVAVAIAPDASNAEGSASSFARSDHTHQFTCAAPTTNLSATTTNQEGSGTNFVRDSHTHAINNSNNPGAAVSLLSSSAAGKLTLVDLALTSLTASTAIYANASKEIVSLANAAGYLKNDGAGSLSWDAGITIDWAEAGDLSSIDPDDAANAGVSTEIPRADHQHAITCAAPTTDLSVSTTNAEGAGSNFVRDSHTHAITSSSNPGAAASLLASAADGGLQLIRLGIGTDPDADNGIKIIDDGWIGSGSTAGRLVFDTTPDPDQVEITAADLYFATADRGIIHVDGVAAGSVLVSDGTRYVPGNISDATIDWAESGDLSSIEPDDAASAGVSTEIPRADHQHAIVCAIAGNITPDASAAEGSASSFARSDHTHGITCAAASAISPDCANAEGSASSFARSDHMHQFTCAAPTTDLSATTTNAEGAGSNFVRDSHTHAIVSSNAPGAAVSLLASSAAGKLTLVDLGLTSLTASTIIYSDASKEIESLANGSGYLANDGSGGLSWTPISSTSTLVEVLYLPGAYGGGVRTWAWDATRPVLSTGDGAAVLTTALVPTDYAVETNGGPYVDLNGTTEGLEVSDDTWQEVGAYNVFMWTWVNADTLATNNRTILAKYNANGNNKSWWLGWYSTNSDFMFSVSTNGAAEVAVESSYSESTSTWYFIGAFYQPSTILTIYVGAASDADLTIDDVEVGVPASLYNGTADFTVGMCYDNVTGQWFWDGKIGPTVAWLGIPAANIDDFAELIFDRTKYYYS